MNNSSVVKFLNKNNEIVEIFKIVSPNNSNILYYLPVNDLGVYYSMLDYMTKKYNLPSYCAIPLLSDDDDFEYYYADFGDFIRLNFNIIDDSVVLNCHNFNNNAEADKLAIELSKEFYCSPSKHRGGK